MKNMDPDFIIKAMQSTEYKDRRCIYENEDVLVEHRVTKYPSVDRETVLLVHLKKDDVRLEQKHEQHLYHVRLTDHTQTCGCFSTR